MLMLVEKFLAKHWDGKSPLLLGYSGGPDSKALLYALLEAGCPNLHLAHVDHGWRQESREEAASLKEEAERLHLPFHTIRLAQSAKEAEARRERFSFFQALFDQIPFQALLLGHHAGDVAETVLKRVLEGAHLPFLCGMQSVSQREKMAVWRPLISVKKEEIFAFLEERRLTFLVDRTNFDSSYLRARMRMEILPELASRFGKGIADNLLLLSQRAAELKAYLGEKTKHHIPKRGPWGLFGDLSGVERIEARYLIQLWTDETGISLSRSLLESALDAIALGVPNRKIAERVFVDRGMFFCLVSKLPEWGAEPLEIKVGSWRFGDWQVDVSEELESSEPCSWREVWSGRFQSLAPSGWLEIPSTGGKIRHLWNQKKIPAFFRYRVPVVASEGGILKEFLTGKILPEIRPSFKLTISNRSGTSP